MTPRQSHPTYDAHQAVSAIEERIAKGEVLLLGPELSKDDLAGWRFVTEETLRRCFPGDGSKVAAILNTGPAHRVNSFTNPQYENRMRRERLEAVLSQLRHALEIFALPAGVAEVEPSTAPDPEVDGRVFVVHGRDDLAKHEVSSFLRTIGLDPIILHEQPNRGQTIIEKFERHARTSFAVVIMTPDDEGRLAGDPTLPLKPRARQNVVMELAYLMGTLGRSRVCALLSPSVEAPSDFAGIVYVPFDGGKGWQFELMRELKAAGFEIKIG